MIQPYGVRLRSNHDYHRCIQLLAMLYPVDSAMQLGPVHFGSSLRRA